MRSFRTENSLLPEVIYLSFLALFKQEMITICKPSNIPLATVWKIPPGWTKWPLGSPSTMLRIWNFFPVSSSTGKPSTYVSSKFALLSGASQFYPILGPFSVAKTNRRKSRTTSIDRTWGGEKFLFQQKSKGSALFPLLPLKNRRITFDLPSLWEQKNWKTGGPKNIPLHFFPSLPGARQTIVKNPNPLPFTDRLILLVPPSPSKNFLDTSLLLFFQKNNTHTQRENSSRYLEFLDFFDAMGFAKLQFPPAFLPGSVGGQRRGKEAGRVEGRKEMALKDARRAGWEKDRLLWHQRLEGFRASPEWVQFWQDPLYGSFFRP